MAIQTRYLGSIFLVLLLVSVGIETRPLNPTIVSEMFGTSNWKSIQPIAEEGGKRDEQRLSPGGPDAHHH